MLFACDLYRGRFFSFCEGCRKSLEYTVYLYTVVIVERVSDEENVVRRFRRVKDPLKILIGKTPSLRHVPVEELEEKAETR